MKKAIIKILGKAFNMTIVSLVHLLLFFVVVTLHYYIVIIFCVFVDNLLLLKTKQFLIIKVYYCKL